MLQNTERFIQTNFMNLFESFINCLGKINEIVIFTAKEAKGVLKALRLRWTKESKMLD